MLRGRRFDGEVEVGPVVVDRDADFVQPLAAAGVGDALR